jgi:branched-chain amino acid transport system permease protein
MAVLGGIGTLWGSVLGAALVLLLRDWLSGITDASGIITGAVFVALVLGFRRGIWPTAGDLVRRAGRRAGIGAPSER